VPWIYQNSKTAYMVPMESSGKTIGGVGTFGRFVDPYDASFRESLRTRLLGDLKETINDPYCIGYFVDNEMPWGDVSALGLRALVTAGDRQGKIAFVQQLKNRYDSIDALNQAWGSAFESWDAFQNSTKAPVELGKAYSDLTNYTFQAAKQYFKVVSEVIRELAPQHLYLGCRYSGYGINPLTVLAAAMYADAVSFNVYEFSPTEQAHMELVVDKPVMIGEFHFGAMDRGQFHPGIVRVSDQKERADAYKKYVEAALRHPQIISCHWFQYVDSPTTGRSSDGENFQIGFVDNSDTTYPEIIEASREIGNNLYEMRLKK
jgi:hypothetical protein